MASEARARLAQSIAEHGNDGLLLVFNDAEDPLGTSAEGADLAPHSGVGGPRPTLRERVAEANRQSRLGRP